MQQLSMFTIKAELKRKNEYEVSHCTNCGCIVPDRILIGNWPYTKYNINFCPNCGAQFASGPNTNNEEELKEGWCWEAIKIYDAGGQDERTKNRSTL